MVYRKIESGYSLQIYRMYSFSTFFKKGDTRCVLSKQSAEEIIEGHWQYYGNMDDQSIRKVLNRAIPNVKCDEFLITEQEGPWRLPSVLRTKDSHSEPHRACTASFSQIADSWTTTPPDRNFSLCKEILLKMSSKKV